MIRTQIRITPAQARALKRLAAKEGKSVAGLIRQSVDSLLQSSSLPDQDALRAKALAASGIRKYYALDKLTKAEAEEALVIFDQMQIQFVPEDLIQRQAALRWAVRLRQKAAYDGFYLAAAEQLGAEFWTADQSLCNHARQAGATWVHWLGEVK